MAKQYFTKSQKHRCQNKAPAFERAYHIADAHNRIEMPVAAAKAFGDIDFLILNGNILNHSGNHDLRGNFAKRFADYTPSQNRNTYYTFRLGSIWGLLLGCGEDKADFHEEYGYTVACHPFRERQTEFIKSVIDNADKEYLADGVKTRIVISHNPFTEEFSQPFNIEKDICSKWAKLLKETIKTHVMICGHTHKVGILYPKNGDTYIIRPCPIVIGSQPESDRFIGCGYIFHDNEIQVVFTDSLGNKISTDTIKAA